jgi:hypothetical protein
MEDPDGADADRANAGLMPLVAAKVASAPTPAHRLRTLRRETPVPQRASGDRNRSGAWCSFPQSVAVQQTMPRHTLMLRHARTREDAQLRVPHEIDQCNRE